MNKTSFLALSLLAALAGCSGSSSSGNPPVPPFIVPSLQLSQSQVQFDGLAMTGHSGSQVIDVDAIDADSLAGLSASVAYAGGVGDWLDVSFSRTTTPAALLVSASSTAASGAFPLDGGTYRAVVTVSSSDANVPPVQLSVTYDLEPVPEIGLSTTRVEMNSFWNEAPVPQAVDVRAPGAVELEGLSASIAYGAGEQTGWLSVSLDSSTTPAELTLQANPSGLAYGLDHFAVVEVTSSSTSAPRYLRVYYEVTSYPAPDFGLSHLQVAGNTFQIGWSYSWPATVGNFDRFFLERSLVGPETGYAMRGYWSDREPVMSVQLTEVPGVYWYRVQARRFDGLTEYSEPLLVEVGSVDALIVNNNTFWPLTSMKLNGVEHLPEQQVGVPDRFYNNVPGFPQPVGLFHVEAEFGLWRENGSRLPVKSKSLELFASGVSGVSINLDRDELSDMLVPSGGSDTWYATYWRNGEPHVAQVVFHDDGRFECYDDQERIASGEYDAFDFSTATYRFRLAVCEQGVCGSTLGVDLFDAHYDELNGCIELTDGPAPWPGLELRYLAP